MNSYIALLSYHSVGQMCHFSWGNPETGVNVSLCILKHILLLPKCRGNTLHPSSSQRYTYRRPDNNYRNILVSSIIYLVAEYWIILDDWCAIYSINNLYEHEHLRTRNSIFSSYISPKIVAVQCQTLSIFLTFVSNKTSDSCVFAIFFI